MIPLSARWFRLLSVLVVPTLVACGSTNYGIQRLGIRTTSRHSADLVLSIRVAQRANLNRPVRVDLVLIYDSTLLETVGAFAAAKWFEERDLTISDNFGKMDVFTWEWVPGQTVPSQAVPISERVAVALLFADYDSPGEHRVKLNHLRNALVEFGERGFEVRQKQ